MRWPAMPPASFARPAAASAIPSTAPKAVAPRPNLASWSGKTEVAISCPASERRLVTPKAATVRFNQPRRPSVAAPPTGSRFVDEVDDHARTELRLEPCALGRHHPAGVGDAHDIGEARRVHRERNRVLPGVHLSRQLVNAADPAAERDAR